LQRSPKREACQGAENQVAGGQIDVFAIYVNNIGQNPSQPGF
jgi:hypothetical protein